MLKLSSICTIGWALFLGGCCTSHVGYGRYTLESCDSVEIDGTTYTLTKPGTEFVFDSHTMARGIYRKTTPWLYVHRIGSSDVDVTVESGAKSGYPLYTGSSASIFDTLSKPWEMTRSTCASFAGDHWLVSHRWTSDGVFFDLQKKGASDTQWTLVDADIFVPSDGSTVDVPQISIQVQILSFDATAKKAMVKFTSL